MENRFIGALVGVAVIVIILAAMFPVILGTQSNFTETRYYNDSGLTFREMHDGDIFTIERSETDTGIKDIWMLNGEDVTRTVASWDVALMSDSVYVSVNNQVSSSAGSYLPLGGASYTYIGLGDGVEWARFSFEWVGSNIVISKELSIAEKTVVGTYPVTWAFVLCPIDEGAYMASSAGSGAGFVRQDSEVILCGRYDTGELDTFYCWRDGVFSTGTDITGTADFDLSLVGGTTDIYRITVNVEVTSGDVVEDFTPFKVLVPYEIVGHVESNAASDLVGLVPILLIVSLLLMAVGLIVRSRF